MSEFHAGDPFAGYTLRRFLAADDAGEVYEAIHPRIPWPVALRILPPGTFAYPNVIGLRDRGEFNGRLWFTTDHAGTDDVTEVVGNQQPPPRYLGSDHAPLARPVAPPHPGPPPPIQYPSPPRQYGPPPQPPRSRRGLIIGGAIAAVVILTAAVVTIAVLNTGDTETAAPSKPARTATSTATTSKPTIDPSETGVTFTFDHETRDVGEQVICTPLSDSLGGGLGVIIGTYADTIVVNLGPGSDPVVEAVTLPEIDGIKWLNSDDSGHGEVDAVSDGKRYQVSGDAWGLDPSSGVVLKTFELGFTCP